MTTTQLAGAGSSAPAPIDPQSADNPEGAHREIGTLPLSRLRRVTEYIREHLDQNIKLAQLGAVVYMSPFHFARLFQRTTGLPPHRFVVRSRIERATLLLGTPELSIAAIARAVGFRNPSHFSTVFRRNTGVTPRVYRAQLLRQARLPRADTPGAAPGEVSSVGVSPVAVSQVGGLPGGGLNDVQ
ncbi:MAG TPA: AraC family transcriptional regulator [Methylomirabilota bacterium]|nr:AraC family transcriptional regulator [Methylomirabilota bacterium]